MDAQKVDMYIMTNQKFFPAEKIMFLKEKLLSADESKLNLVNAADLKDPTTILLIFIFVGSLGVDRFMIGDTGMGVLKLLTAGVCGILTIVDWFTISNKTRELNFQKVMTII
ncbi:MAG TPA: TM2 domain-containing protein [Bacillota bacterium]|nr:TM2 domain-containing protein [Bacillota bacterium]HPP85682.1 TM2 domain-containing protein [Bacillota bacterium]